VRQGKNMYSARWKGDVGLGLGRVVVSLPVLTGS
jgi:hypothetical protein